MNVIESSTYRISVLTDRLIRLEYQQDGFFEDRPTQVVINRDFGNTEYSLSRDKDDIIMETDRLKLRYDCMAFSSVGLSVCVKETGELWHFGDVFANSDRNLGGTARTLDQTDGFAELNPGIFGEYGYAIIDDSMSAVYEDGEFRSRAHLCTDIYFFGYGRDYFGGLHDFYSLTGKTPMLPRYALGNWWSRFYRYTEESYLSLLDNFEKEDIPLSVAVIDMDWHITEVDGKYGTGWTGFTWNKELFPDHRRFLRELKNRKLAVTLNLHPADGVRGFEEAYPAVAKRLGIDPASDKACDFDFSDPDFRAAYFEEIIHPYEEEGVDFWWIDWQQGTGKTNDAADPLFLLNHYHYKDQEDRSARPMIFSRYAGVGSHRYPIGFSGDTRATWRSLAFQPYFTSTASNIGYGWWSHDIGGHMHGDRDDERLIRWIQYGVFSPIMRIHSTNSPFANKEPWLLTEPYRSIMGYYMRLRHSLIPYLYTQVHKASAQDTPVIQPVYYRNADQKAAYGSPNTYYFGDSLMVSAITEPMDRQLRMAETCCFIPEGRWVDIFTGMVYEGAKKRKLYRPLDKIPVLLCEGGIVPLASGHLDNGTDNPDSLRILFGAGGSGKYTLYEDDGISMEYKKGRSVTTPVLLEWNTEARRCVIRLGASEGDTTLIPKRRNYELVLCGAESYPDIKAVCVDQDGKEYNLQIQKEKQTGFLSLTVPDRAVGDSITVTVSGIGLKENDSRAFLFEILDRAWIESLDKERIYDAFINAPSSDAFLTVLSSLDISETLKDAIREIY